LKDKGVFKLKEEVGEMERKISKVGWLIVVSCIVLGGGLARAQSPGTFKPGSEEVFLDGFRGIKWGQDISTVEGLIYASTVSGIDYYAREGDELKIKDIPTFSLYWFGENKFFGGQICVMGDTNWEIFKTAVFEKFGKGEQENEHIEEYFWWGEETIMLLTYDEVSELGFLAVISKKEAYKRFPELWKEWKKQ